MKIFLYTNKITDSSAADKVDDAQILQNNILQNVTNQSLTKPNENLKEKIDLIKSNDLNETENAVYPKFDSQFSDLSISTESNYSKFLDIFNKLNLSVKWIKESDIKLQKLIGKGAQGVVYKGVYLGSNVALKTIQKGRCDKRAYREIKLLDTIRHPNIISIMGFSISLTQIFIVMQFFESDTLFDTIFKEEHRKDYCLDLPNKHKISNQICCALVYLHMQDTPILHWYIKPANVLVNKEFKVKLCDLGYAGCDTFKKV